MTDLKESKDKVDPKELEQKVDLKELERKINVLWKIANICPKCRETALVQSSVAVYPPQYYCPKCDKFMGLGPTVIPQQRRDVNPLAPSPLFA